jgi:competence protein ComEC
MNVVQCCFLFALIISVSYWILNRYKPALFAALLFLVISLGTRLAYRFTVKQQQKLIVYNIPRLTAIDLVDGNKFSFIGDRMLQKNELYLKYLKPARTALGTDENEQAPVAAHPPIYRIAGNNILLLDAGSSFKKTETLKKIAVVVLSKNPVLYMDTLIKYFEIGQVVADGSNPEWKIKLWQKDCIRLQIPFYNAAEAAFIKSF